MERREAEGPEFDLDISGAELEVLATCAVLVGASHELGTGSATLVQAEALGRIMVRHIERLNGLGMTSEEVRQLGSRILLVIRKERRLSAENEG